MSLRFLRQAAAFCLSSLLLCAQTPAQAPGTGWQAQASVRPDPKRAHKAAERGDNAEAGGRVEEALAAYDEAARYAPQDAAILERGAALRSRLVRGHVEAAERQALAGDFAQATEELYAALRIDPGNSILGERLAQMQAMGEEGPPAKQESGTENLPRLKPQSVKRSFQLRGDTRSVYEEVAKAFGITAAFDPDLASHDVRLRVQDVDFSTAMSLLAAETRTFWRPVNATLLFVAPDTPEKRRNYGLQAERTFTLSSSLDPEDMTELLRVLREITGATHIELDTRSHSITLRDAPEKLALAGAVIRQADRARGEVLLEIELLEIDHGTGQKLGITPPDKARLYSIDPNILTQLKQAQDITALTTLLARIFGGAGGAAGGNAQFNLSSLIPPLIAVGGGKTTFLLTLPGAAVDFSSSLSLVRSGRQILLRAQDGKPATFFVGDRYPVTLSLLSSSLGQGTPAGVLSSGVFPRNDINVGQGPVALVARDFNGDNKPDLAVVNNTDNTVTILLNQGSGNFAANGTPIAAGKGPSAIATAVLRNPSTTPDLLVANSISNDVTVLLGNGDGAFTAAPGSPFAAGHGPSAIVTADFDGDGNQDFAVTNFTDNTVSIFLGDGKGGFTPAKGSPIPLPNTAQGPLAMVVDDFNADGKPDLAIVNKTTNNVTILLGNGNATFTEAKGSPIAVGNEPVAIASGDLNGDARPDLAIVNQADNSLTVLLNNGDATFNATMNSPFSTGVTPSRAAIADFNQDGKGDIAVTDSGANSVSVYIGLGAGLIAPRFALPTKGGPSAIVATDLNADGFPDAAVTDKTDNQVSVILSPTSFLPNVQTAQTPYPGSEFVDLGVKVKATPMLHDNNEVTLQLEFEIKSLSGSSVNGIPVISNRTLSQTVRVKVDEATLIGGLLDKQETHAITGLPGFAEIPVAGYAFGRRDTSLQDTELLILVTPRKLRLPNRHARTIFAGQGDTGGRGANAPTSQP